MTKLFMLKFNCYVISLAEKLVFKVFFARIRLNKGYQNKIKKHSENLWVGLYGDSKFQPLDCRSVVLPIELSNQVLECYYLLT